MWYSAASFRNVVEMAEWRGKRVWRVVSAAALATAIVLSTACDTPAADARQADLGSVAIIGDSLTSGYGVAPAESYASLLEARTPGDDVLPLAHDGATVRTWLTVYRGELARLTPWRPDTVVIALGGNDYYRSRSTADYAANLTALVDAVRATTPGARVVLWHYYRIGPAPVRTLCDADQCRAVSPAPTWSQYGATMHAVAQRTASDFIDNSTERRWVEEFPLPGEDPPIHLSAAGHRALERSLHARLLDGR